jgi:hypothetical protein
LRETFLPPSEQGVQVKLIKGILLGIVALATSQAIAKADDGTTKDIRLLKAQRSILLQPALRFAGVGCAPKTDDHIVMTQVRYYPF